MLEKVKSMPRVITSIICIVMSFFTFVSHFVYSTSVPMELADKISEIMEDYRNGKYHPELWELESELSGIDIIEINYVFLLLILIPVFIILVDVGIVKIEKVLVEKIILACSAVQILIAFWMYKVAGDYLLALSYSSDNKLKSGIGMWGTLICAVVCIVITLKHSFDIDVVENVKSKVPVDKIPVDKIPLDKIPLDKVNVDALKEKASSIKDMNITMPSFGNDIVCEQCGTSNKSSQKFCGTCGAKIVVPKKKVCKACNKIYAPDVNFCQTCGAKTEDYEKPQCSKCGFEFKKSYKFCPKCGEKVEE